MHFRIELNEIDRTVTFAGELSMREIGMLKLDPVDYELLIDEPLTEADGLRFLEMIFRRFREQFPHLCETAVERESGSQ